MKEIYSIGYVDSYNDFTKLRNDKGDTVKFKTIEEAESYIINNLDKTLISKIRIMQGWKVVKEI